MLLGHGSFVRGHTARTGVGMRGLAEGSHAASPSPSISHTAPSMRPLAQCATSRPDLGSGRGGPAPTSAPQTHKKGWNKREAEPPPFTKHLPFAPSFAPQLSAAKYSLVSFHREGGVRAAASPLPWNTGPTGGRGGGKHVAWGP